jgi:hypothetical protein
MPNIILAQFERLIGKFLPEQFRPDALSLVKWLLIGYLIRSIIAPLLVSTDYVVLMWRTFSLVQTHQWVPMGDPPLISLMMAPVLIIFSGQSTNMFGDIVNNVRFSPFVSSVPIRMANEGTTTLLFATKIPYIIMDIAMALLLLHLISDAKKGKIAFKLWLLNPITIFISFAIGQYDVFPVFFLMLSLYFLKTDRSMFSALSLGVAAAFKWFAFPFLFPFALFFSRQQFIRRKKILNFLKYCAIGLIPLFLSLSSSLLISPYYEPINAAFPNFEYYNGYYGSKLSIPWLSISSPLLANLLIFTVDFAVKVTLFQPVELYLLFLFYGLFFLACVYFKKWTFSTLWKAMLVFFMLYYAFSHFHAQWFLWGMPFLILLMVEDRRFLKMLPFFFVLYFIYTFYWDSAITTNLLVPVIPQAWGWMGPVGLLTGLGLPAVEILNMFRSLFSALCIFAAIIALVAIYREFKNAGTSTNFDPLGKDYGELT